MIKTMGNNNSNSDRKFIALMVFSIILVIIVVGVSQYSQFRLGSTSVEQNAAILNVSKEISHESLKTYQAVNTTVNHLTEFEKQFEQNSILVLKNISMAHDALLKHVESIDQMNSNRNLKLTDLLNNQTSNIIHDLQLHVNNTAENLNLTKTNYNNIINNHDFIKKNNQLMHEILDLLLVNKTK